jgi:hypothetical protein
VRTVFTNPIDAKRRQLTAYSFSNFVEFKPMKSKNTWSVNDGKIIFHHPGMDVFWNVPLDFEMPSLPILSLAEYILLQPHGVKVDIVPESRHREGRAIAVAYSGGVDSTAAVELLPGSIPIYTKVRQKGQHRLENALLALDEVNGIAVESNYDEFSLLFGKKSGYFGLGGFTITCVLFSEYYSLKTICDGNVLETAYLHSPSGHGTRYNLRDQGKIFNAFNLVGLNYAMPCAGLTEVSTTKIAESYHFAMGCMRGFGGRPCYKCMKCYRKGALQGKPIPTNPEVEKKFSGNIIPMLPSLLWARDKHGLSHPKLNCITKNIDWVDKWYPKSKEFMPHDMTQAIRGQLIRYGIEEMSDFKYIESWVSDRAGCD